MNIINYAMLCYVMLCYAMLCNVMSALTLCILIRKATSEDITWGYNIMKRGGTQ